MGPDFQFLSRRHQVWVPAVIDPANRDYRYLTVVARLNTSRGAAAAEMTGAGRGRSRKPTREAIPAGPFRSTISRITWSTAICERGCCCCSRRWARYCCWRAPTSRACCWRDRRREAGRSPCAFRWARRRSRVVRQLLTESVMLALMGAALGLGLAALLIDLAPGFVPVNAIPTTAPIQLNVLVLSLHAGRSRF